MAKEHNPPSKETSVEEAFARMFPPKGFENHDIVRVGEYVVWKHEDDITDDDLICFYDGDCRDVLLPDDPRLSK